MEKIPPMTAHQPYSLLRSFDRFELRRYPEYAVVQVHVDGGFVRAGNRGFRPLFNYISGDNRSAAKFSMTAPVIQQKATDHVNIISFVLPAGTDRDAIPAPAIPRSPQRLSRHTPSLPHASAEAGLNPSFETKACNFSRWLRRPASKRSARCTTRASIHRGCLAF
jgi:hypothetical protein